MRERAGNDGVISGKIQVDSFSGPDMVQAARDHHYAPQFYLRLFASDSERRKINTLRRIGPLALWSERSIKEIGYEKDFYVSDVDGIPICHEQQIGQEIENPITQSDTWRKIQQNASSSLDRTDKRIIYALIRHFEARNPHYLAIFRELSTLAFENSAAFPFGEQDRLWFKQAHLNPKLLKNMINDMSSSLAWTAAGFEGAGVTIARSPIRLRSSTTPVLVLPAAAHSRLGPLSPGMVPFQYVLTLNPYTVAMLNLGSFDDAFWNTEIDIETAKGFNRQYMAYFAKFPSVEHLITEREGLIEDATWAPYRVISQEPKTLKFKRLETIRTKQESFIGKSDT